MPNKIALNKMKKNGFTRVMTDHSLKSFPFSTMRPIF